jgi:hypothetical protein
MTLLTRMLGGGNSMTKPTMQDIRGALEASGLPVLHSGYSLRFPNPPRS